MINPLIRKLERFVRLSQDDRRVLDELVRHRLRRFGPREDIIHEGARPRDVNLVFEGWACRYKTLEDGRRQIVSYFVPGDFCDLHVFVLREMDHSLGCLTPATIAEIPRDRLLEVTANHPRITQALWWSGLVNEAIQREWTINLGQRSAYERVAHLLCELFIRLQTVGLTQGNRCEWPVTQAELADTVGLSTVHVNRTLQELRQNGLITLKGRDLIIPDLAALKEAGLFNPNYLHLDHEGMHLDAND